jgi:hypothetical protein
MDRNVVMTEVHRRFASAEPELENGFAEHATMGAEAMLTLGIDPEAVLAWADRHDPVPVADGSQLVSIRRAILGELTDGDWRDVVRRHVALLVGALDAHLFHGLIRTAHAIRALHDHDDHDARAELAAGLAVWTLWAGGDRRDVAPRTSDAPQAEILEMARRGAAAFVSAPSIFTIHAVTAPMAHLLLAEHLDAGTNAVAASVFARTHQRHLEPPSRNDDRARPDAAQLATLAKRWDAHPAKLVEAAVRGSEATGDAAFLDAVAVMMAE